MHLPRVHAIHPAHWLAEHPLILALLIAGAITLFITGLAYLQSSGSIRFDLPENGVNYPAMSPYGSL